MKYARVLIENCPQEATAVFVEYYTGKYRPRRKVIEVDGVPTVAPGGLAAGAANAMQNFSNLITLPYMPGAAKPNGKQAAAVEEPEEAPGSEYTPPPPRTAFSSFIDHPDEFILFLESCLK